MRKSEDSLALSFEGCHCPWKTSVFKKFGVVSSKFGIVLWPMPVKEAVCLRTSQMKNTPASTSPCPTTGRTTSRWSISAWRASLSSALCCLFPAEHPLTSSRPRRSAAWIFLVPLGHFDMLSLWILTSHCSILGHMCLLHSCTCTQVVIAMKCDVVTVTVNFFHLMECNVIKWNKMCSAAA